MDKIFYGELAVNEHIERWEEKEPRRTVFSNKNSLMFEDYHMEQDVPIRTLFGVRMPKHLKN